MTVNTLDQHLVRLRSANMEHLISIIGLVAGLIGFFSTLFSRIAISIKGKSVEIIIGNDEGVREVRIFDISSISKEEMENIKNQLKTVEVEGAGGDSNE